MLGNLYRYGLALVKIFWRSKDYLKSFGEFFTDFSAFDVIIDSSGGAI